MSGICLVAALALIASPIHAPAYAASGREPAPPGSFKGAPPQYTRFSTHELMRGFMALAFGSDFLVGKKPKGIRRYDHPIAARVIPGGKVDRTAAMTRVLEEYARRVPNLRLSVVSGGTPADVEVRLIDEKNFESALEAAFGAKVTHEFMQITDPICMTSVKSDAGGEIVHSVSFVVVDQGDDVFLDCAYHELLHAFGLPNHDQHNPWTTLNQNRMVGYLSVYDRDLVTLLYDPHIKPGMTRRQVRRLLPRLIAALGLAKLAR
jgi:Protein of unknown function (DUF2927)